MTRILALFRDRSGSAAAEMAMVTPLLLVVMFGSVELGNYFLSQHALTKQVRDGSRYASRINLVDNYTCATGASAGTAGSDATTEIRNVTRTGTIDGGGDVRRPFSAGEASCGGAAQTVNVSVRCADKDSYPGIWRELEGDIPVVKVDAAVTYRPVLAAIGINATGLCLRAESEMPVMGA